MTSTKKLTHLALLTAVALGLYILESMLPPLTSIPGIKLGLANIITLVALYLYKPMDAFWILLTRILLGSFFSAQMMTLFFSLAGGLLCWLVSCLLYRFIPVKQIWILSVIGAVCHNIGQILVAIVVTGTTDILWYLPFLLIAGCISGLFTGLVAGLLIPRISKSFTKKTVVPH